MTFTHLAALPATLSEEDRVYFQPCRIARRADVLSSTGLEDFPLVGGPLSFDQVTVFLRSLTDPSAVSAGTFLAEQVRDWAAIQGGKVARQFVNLTTPRAAIAGITWDSPRLMGILNVTPDSFSDGGQFLEADKATAHAKAMQAAGATLLDIGGESTRPGAAAVSLEEEQRRVLPVVAALKDCGVPTSIDSRNGATMRAAVEAGAAVVNDVSALTHDPAALRVVAELEVPVILMHTQGDPKDMQKAPHYDQARLDVYDWLEERVEACEAAGIDRSRLIVDPGIGFGKTPAHNMDLFQGLALLHGLGTVVLLAASRKSFIAKLSKDEPADQRLPGSLSVVLQGVGQGIQLFRVHDVAETAQALTIWQHSAMDV